MMESRYQDGSGSGKLNVVSFGIFRRICLSIKKTLMIRWFSRNFNGKVQMEW